MLQKIRYEWVDALKFLGIFAIYLGHFGPSAGKLYPFVFSYHVPLFFFAAGFFSSKKNKGTIFEFIKGKANRLLLPYFSFAILSLIINSINSGVNLDSILSHLFDIFCGVRNNPYVGTIWFINCLFTISILDELTRRVIRSDTTTLVLSILSLVYSQTLLSHNPLITPSWFWNADSALAYWWLLALGRSLFKWISSDSVSFRTASGWLLFSLCSAFTANQLYNGQSLLEPAASFLKLDGFMAFGVLNNIVSTTLLILFNVFIAKLICRSHLILSIGRNTLNICGLENITKLLLPAGLSIIGIPFSLQSPLAAIAYTMVCIYVSQKIGLWLAENIRGPFSLK